MMKTITVQIGNSDDKLTQKKWAEYVMLVDSEIRAWSHQIHFFGESASISPWQNACWVFEIDETSRDYWVLRSRLEDVAREYTQDSIAFTIGETILIRP